MILSLFSCAEMTSILPTITSISVNSVSVKTAFMERFDIPELVTDDVDENENELNFILESFSKFAVNPDHVYQALRSEFMYGNVFNVLQLNLMRYFDRYEPFRNRLNDVIVLLKANKFDYLFDVVPRLLKDLGKAFSEDYKLMRALQEYIVANPQHLDLVKMHLERARRSTKEPERLIIDRWFKVALVSNMPWMIFNVFPKFSRDVFEEPCIWTGIHIPKEHQSEIFEKINFLIDNSEKESCRDIYRLFNSIRYGPDDYNVYRNKIAPNEKGLYYHMLNLCRCASLAGKMTLFYKLLPHAMPFIMREPQKLVQWSNGVNDDCLAMHKFIFDVHENCLDSCLQILYDRTNFLNIASRYYRIEFIKLNGNNIFINFSSTVYSSEFPESLIVNYRAISSFKMQSLLDILKFDRADMLEGFQLDLFKIKVDDGRFDINDANLNLIIKSESIRQMIYEHMQNSLIRRQPFLIHSSDFFKIDNDYDFPLSDIVRMNDCGGRTNLSELRSTEQARKWEILIGYPLIIFMSSNNEYFKHRHVYKYLVENGKELPKNLSEKTRQLLRIEFPTLNIE